MSESSEGTNDSAAPTWFQLELERGLQHLWRLRLVNRPPTEADLQDAVDGWIVQLWQGYLWDNHRDTPGLRTAFRETGNASRYWPTPSDLISAMAGNLRTLPVVTSDQLALPEPGVGDFPPGTVGEQIRLTIRMLPTEQHRVAFFKVAVGRVLFGGVRSGTVHVPGPKDWRKELLEACEQVQRQYGGG